MAQLPYDLNSSEATVEIEDKNGRKNALPLTIKPVVPVGGSVVGSTASNALVRRPGEEVVVKLTGLGATDVPAPWGDVAAGTVHPLARIEAFVGGRTARVLDSQLSRSEPGVFEVRLEVPPIAPDLHVWNLRVAGIDVSLGSILVTK